MFGTTYRATAHNPERRYYKCHGKDPVLAAREKRCPQSSARAAELEAAIWNHVSALLQDPERLLAQFEQFAHEAVVGSEREQEAQERDEAHLKRLQRQEQRLIDAYQADVIRLEELSERRQLLTQQRQALILQQEQRVHLRLQAVHAQQVLQDVRTFCTQVESRLDNVTFDEKQKILQLVIERVIVGEDTLEIRHVIPLRRGAQQSGEPVSDSVELRSDGPSAAERSGLSAATEYEGRGSG